MFQFPIKYDEPLFRPPSESRSLILQLTHGCSWNKCAFCEMYSTKKFHVRKLEDIFNDIDAFLPYSFQIRRVFLADGDPLVLSTKKLIAVLKKIRSTFSRITRISAYASPSNLNKKSLTELTELKNAGLDLLYIGIESGDDEVLKIVNKGETFASTVRGLNKAALAGIQSSVMIINGLGGQEYSHQHAVNSAKVLNEIQPKYASTLVLSLYKALQQFKNRIGGKDFKPLSVIQLLEEKKELISKTELNETIFRSDHASNYLVLKGVLGKDKTKFLNQIDFALENPDLSELRQEFERGF